MHYCVPAIHKTDSRHLSIKMLQTGRCNSLHKNNLAQRLPILQLPVPSQLPPVQGAPDGSGE